MERVFTKKGFKAINVEEDKNWRKTYQKNKHKKILFLIPSGELSRARGGSHCMSMPLKRDAWG